MWGSLLRISSLSVAWPALPSLPSPPLQIYLSGQLSMPLTPLSRLSLRSWNRSERGLFRDHRSGANRDKKEDRGGVGRRVRIFHPTLSIEAGSSPDREEVMPIASMWKGQAEADIRVVCRLRKKEGRKCLQ